MIDWRALDGVDVNTGIFEADVVRNILDRLAALMPPPLKPPDGLGDTPDALDPLG